eukprot:1451819-Rhodomonas_salina.1
MAVQTQNVVTVGLDGGAMGFVRMSALGCPQFETVDMDGPPPYEDPASMRVLFDMQRGIITDLEGELLEMQRG